MRMIPTVGAATIAALAALPTGASVAACKPVDHKIDGNSARTFCGPATATVTFAGKTLHVRKGRCERTKRTFTIQLGTIVYSKPPNQPDWFVFSVGNDQANGIDASKDGAYKDDFSMQFVDHSINYTVRRGTVRLKANRHKGTWTGKLLDGTAASGSFDCG